MRAVVGPPVQSALDVLLVLRVLVRCAGFGRQQGHVVAEGVQRAAVAGGGGLTELLRNLWSTERKERDLVSSDSWLTQVSSAWF